MDDKTVAIDFDGVIHSMKSGWLGPNVLEEPVEGAVEAIKTLQADGWEVIIFSARAGTQEGIDAIVSYLEELGLDSLEVTNEKPVASVYIDDRALTFNGNWNETLSKIPAFKTWQEKAQLTEKIIPSDNVLYSGPYLKVAQDAQGYERCIDRTGKTVGILPYRVKEDGTVMFTIRREGKSAWSRNPHKRFMTSITGGVDEGETFEHAAVRELYEEAGIQVQEENLIYLGETYAAKCLDTLYQLYAVDVSEFPFKSNGPTDGSEGEALAKNQEVSWRDANNASSDAILSTMLSWFTIELLESGINPFEVQT